VLRPHALPRSGSCVSPVFVSSWGTCVRLIAAVLVALSASGCDVTLVRALSREQAHDIVRVLDRSGVVARALEDSADGTEARWRIEVDGAAVATSVAALNASRNRALTSAKAEPPARASAWIETPSEERARHASQLSAQLERSLMRLPGVIEARVHITLPFGMHSLREAQTPPAASALVVRAKESNSVAAAATELIAGAVPGLAPSAVRVVETIAQPSAAPKPQFTRLGPVVVTRDTASTLKWWIAASLVLNMLLAVVILRPLLRRPKPAAATKEAAGTESSTTKAS
jgi:type III secretion protein J